MLGKGCGYRNTCRSMRSQTQSWVWGAPGGDPELPVPQVPPKLEADCSRGTWTGQDPWVCFCKSKPPQEASALLSGVDKALRGHHPGPAVDTSHQQIPNSISRIAYNFAFIYIFSQWKNVGFGGKGQDTGSHWDTG